MLNNYFVTRCGQEIPDTGVVTLSSAGYFLANNGNCWQTLSITTDPPTMLYVSSYTNCDDCLDG
jgi:hypothetical protein